MDTILPRGRCFQTGTLSGQPGRGGPPASASAAFLKEDRARMNISRRDGERLRSGSTPLQPRPEIPPPVARVSGELMDVFLQPPNPVTVGKDAETGAICAEPVCVAISGQCWGRIYIAVQVNSSGWFFEPVCPRSDH